MACLFRQINILCFSFYALVSNSLHHSRISSDYIQSRLFNSHLQCKLTKYLNFIINSRCLSYNSTHVIITWCHIDYDILTLMKDARLVNDQDEHDQARRKVFPVKLDIDWWFFMTENIPMPVKNREYCLWTLNW